MGRPACSGWRRSRWHTSMPPGAGIITSRQTRSGVCSAIARSVDCTVDRFDDVVALHSSGACGGAQASPARRRRRGSAAARGSRQQVPGRCRRTSRSRSACSGSRRTRPRARVPRSPTMAWAVKATMRRPARRASSARSSRSVPASRPCRGARGPGAPGRGAASRASAMPSAAVSAVSTSCPAACEQLGGQRPVRRRVLDHEDRRHYCSTLCRARRRRACAGAGPAGPACSGSRRRPRAGRPGRRRQHDHRDRTRVGVASARAGRPAVAARRRTSSRIAAAGRDAIDGRPRGLGPITRYPWPPTIFCRTWTTDGSSSTLSSTRSPSPAPRAAQVVAARGRRATVQRQDEVEDAPSARARSRA